MAGGVKEWIALRGLRSGAMGFLSSETQGGE